MELLTMDWSGLALTFFLIYGIYAPCLLTLLDNRLPFPYRCFAMLTCLCLSWFGYWLNRRHLSLSDVVR